MNADERRSDKRQRFPFHLSSVLICVHLRSSAAKTLLLTHKHFKNATKSFFSSSVSFVSSTKLKNSTTSSSVSKRPSCRYGGLSLIPRSGNVLIGPSMLALRPSTVIGLKNRSVFRLCIVLSV